MNASQEQRQILKQYNIEIVDDIDEILLALDDKITEVGFRPDYSLNEVGQILQRLYDQLYNQN